MTYGSFLKQLFSHKYHLSSYVIHVDLGSPVLVNQGIVNANQDLLKQPSTTEIRNMAQHSALGFN